MLTVVHRPVDNCVARNIVAPFKELFQCLLEINLKRKPIGVKAKVDPDVMDARQEDEGGPVPLSGCSLPWTHTQNPLLEDGGNVLEK